MSHESDARDDLDPAPTDLTGPDTAGPDAAELEAAMAEARQRLASVPPEVVVVNHVMGLYELAAIHLSSTPPNLPGATLAIDSMALLVDGLGDRLGEDASTMRDALGNIRMAYVSVSASSKAASDGADVSDGAVAGDADAAE